LDSELSFFLCCLLFRKRNHTNIERIDAATIPHTAPAITGAFEGDEERVEAGLCVDVAIEEEVDDVNDSTISVVLVT
jgi:hypothetical protein